MEDDRLAIAREQIQRRRGRYVAQTLDAFERDIEKRLPAGSEGLVQDFKGLIRARFNALATDAIDTMTLGTANGAAQDLRDALEPTGRPH